VAFHVGLGMSTTVRLVRTEGGTALCSVAGVVYVRTGASFFRPLAGNVHLRPPPRPPTKTSLKCQALSSLV
jgi:hypothetical protein